jgi:hypothetical protein
MHTEITNLSGTDTPITSIEGEGVAVTLKPGGSLVIDDPTVTLVTIGDDPDFDDTLTEGVSDVVDRVMNVLTLYRMHQDAEQIDDDEIVCTIENFGRHALRVVPADDPEADHMIVPGQAFSASGLGYVEIREIR